MESFEYFFKNDSFMIKNENLYKIFDFEKEKRLKII